jgi:hypothetical protein
MTTVQRLAHFVVDRSWDDPVGRFVKTQLPPRTPRPRATSAAARVVKDICEGPVIGARSA